MNMSYAIQVGTEIAGSFRVRTVRKRTVMSEMTNAIIDATEVELDSLYENAALLSFFTFKDEPPPRERWTQLVFTGMEDVRTYPVWKPRKIRHAYVCIPYKTKSTSGHITAVTQMLAAKGKTVVSAKLAWFGFPGINQFFVGFKPGMKERTEELLLAGLELV
jgi:hypothetical protein